MVWSRFSESESCSPSTSEMLSIDTNERCAPSIDEKCSFITDTKCSTNINETCSPTNSIKCSPSSDFKCSPCNTASHCYSSLSTTTTTVTTTAAAVAATAGDHHHHHHLERDRYPRDVSSLRRSFLPPGRKRSWCWWWVLLWLLCLVLSSSWDGADARKKIDVYVAGFFPVSSGVCIGEGGCYGDKMDHGFTCIYSVSF